MSDPVEAPAHEDSPSEAISKSIGSVWQRHAGRKPSRISTQIDEGVVTCELQGAIGDRAASPEADAEAAPPESSPESPTYKREAIAVVSRITRRRVMGYIPRHNAKTEVATETFILDGVRQRF